MGSVRMKTPWWRLRTWLADTGNPPSGTVTATPPRGNLPTRNPQRIREAEHDVRAWVKDLRPGLDPGSGAAFDERLNGIGIDWHKQDTDSHSAYLSELGNRIAEAQRLVVASEATIKQADSKRKQDWQDYVDTRRRLGGTPPVGAPEPTGEDGELGPNYREPDLLPGRSRFEPLMWLFALGAVLGDIAAFYGVLAKLFRTEPAFVVMLAVGFAAAAIGICHFIGIGMRRKRSGERRRSNVLLWAKVAAWLTLGGAAFFSRLYLSSDVVVSGGSTSFGSATAVTPVSQNLLAAFTFAGLYAASGLLAMTASYNAFNPTAQAYRRAIRALKDAERSLKNAQSHHAGRLECKKVLEKELERAPQRRAAAYRRTEADVASLKIFARHRIAAELKDADALALLMKDAPKVDPYPEPGGVA